MKKMRLPRKMFYLIALIAIFLSACGAQSAPAATVTECPPFDSQTGWPLASQTSSGCNYAPANLPASTPMPQVAAPAVSICSGYTLVQTVNFGQGSDQAIVKNMDVGDSRLWSIVQAWDTVNVNSTFMAMIEPMGNLDFENARIAGTYWFFTGSADAIQCRANEMWVEHGGLPYRLYVGAIPPANWSTEFPSGWTMKTWKYQNPAIEVAGSVWSTITALNSDANHNYGNANGFGYGQLWDGSEAGVVYHFVTFPGWEITTPKYQGTVWIIGGVNSDAGKSLLQSRFNQMTEEVISRDDQPMVYKFTCGEDTLYGWTTLLPDDWSCNPLP